MIWSKKIQKKKIKINFGEEIKRGREQRKNNKKWISKTNMRDKKKRKRQLFAQLYIASGEDERPRKEI